MVERPKQTLGIIDIAEGWVFRFKAFMLVCCTPLKPVSVRNAMCISDNSQAACPDSVRAVATCRTTRGKSRKKGSPPSSLVRWHAAAHQLPQIDSRARIDAVTILELNAKAL
eukprot:1313118-Pleurochrysis_carterae.AAC.5